MAEFQTVIKQARRMCKTYRDCVGCPLRDNVSSCILRNVCEDDDTIAKWENEVSKWAAEHPYPRYPSWDEVWKMLFPNGVFPCPTYFIGDKDKNILMNCDITHCTECRANPIPADIAEKLGIKPIGEDKNDR